MRAVLTAFALAGLALAVPGAAHAQGRAEAFAALPGESRAALSAWLARNCFQGLAAEEVAALRALSGNIEGALVEAYRDGPPAELARADEAAFAAAFESRNATLAAEGARLFSEEDAARLARVDRDAYVRRRLDGAALNYRTNALLGLGVIGAEGSVGLLSEVAAQSANPMREAARTAIGYLREGVQLAPAPR